MSITKNGLVDDLYKILTSSIANTRFFSARSKGFRAELEYAVKIKEEGKEVLDAGQFVVSKKESNENPENLIFYMTVTSDDKTKYKELYDLISKLPEMRGMFFIEIGDISEWNARKITTKEGTTTNNMQVDIAGPIFSVFRYDCGQWVSSGFNEIKEMLVKKSSERIAKNKENLLEYLSNYDMNDLINVYCNRFVLDVELGEYSKGMMDFDHIVIEDGKYVAVETKEKDPIGKRDFPEDETRWHFGWDSRRIGWYMHLKMDLGLDTRYVIREINNQTEREFVKWKCIDMSRFRRCASWLAERAGGGGGGTISAPYNAFVDI